MESNESSSGSGRLTPSPRPRKKYTLDELTELGLNRVGTLLEGGSKFPPGQLANLVGNILRLQEKQADKPQVDTEEVDVLDLIERLDLSKDKKLELIWEEIHKTESRLGRLKVAVEGLNDE